MVLNLWRKWHGTVQDSGSLLRRAREESIPRRSYLTGAAVRARAIPGEIRTDRREKNRE